MIESRNKALSRRWFEEVWNQRREETITELLPPDAKLWGLEATGHALSGPVEFLRFYRPFRDAFAGLRVVVEDVLAEGDNTVVRLSFTGKHTGLGVGVAPTGRSFHSTAMVWIRWKNGKIAEAWTEFDAAGMIVQLTTVAGAKEGMKLRPN